MPLLSDLLKSDSLASVTALTSAGIGSLSTDIVLQRLAWTLAIVVSLFTVIRNLYRFYKWCKDPFILNFDDDDAKDKD